jgi:hypothetical protein
MKGRKVVDRDSLDALEMRDANILNTQLRVADKTWAFSLRIRHGVINPKPPRSFLRYKTVPQQFRLRHDIKQIYKNLFFL